MRRSRTIRVGLIALALPLLLVSPRQARALFHLSIIDELMTSYNGDPDVQFVEIQMLSGGQRVVEDSVLVAFDTDGAYIADVLVVPGDVTNAGFGVRWIMGTAAFATASGLAPDFVMSPGLPTGGGMVCWGGGTGFTPAPPGSWDRNDFNNYIDCLAYGTYSGPSNVHIGTPTPLDADGHSLRRVNETDDNSIDFACGDPADPTNNAGASVDLAATTSCTPATTTTTTTTTLPAPACGDPIVDSLVFGDGPLAALITPSDALAVLRAAVNLSVCDLCVCDVDGSGMIAPTDALIVLRLSVNLPGELDCPPCT